MSDSDRFFMEELLASLRPLLLLRARALTLARTKIISSRQRTRSKQTYGQS